MTSLHHPHPAIQALVERFHSRSPVRTWSLIVTIFGVVALKERRALRLGELQDWLAACGIEAGLVRTALSRLVASGTLLRGRDGKVALYRLSATAEAAFERAASLIYGPDRPRPTGLIELAVIANGEARGQTRSHLDEAGFLALGSTALVRAEHHDRPMPVNAAVVFLRADVSADLMARAETIWPLAELAAGYQAVIVHAGSVLAASAAMTNEERLLARILLVHEFRRVVLRDPFLPLRLLPSAWPGEAARDTFDRAIGRLAFEA